VALAEVSINLTGQTLKDHAENFKEKLSGYFCAKATGDHKFFLASDDSSKLSISTDMDPANLGA
jgi:hypothetical protein